MLPDTNIFLRFILNDLPKQSEEAEKLFKKAKSGKVAVVVCQLVIFEIHFALLKYYEYPKLVVIKRLTNLISTSYFKVEDREVFLIALKIYESENISFADAFLLAKAKIDKLKLKTFDKKLSKKFVT